jgi:hypothetical protein
MTDTVMPIYPFIIGHIGFGHIGFGYIGTDIVKPICPIINGSIGMDISAWIYRHDFIGPFVWSIGYIGYRYSKTDIVKNPLFQIFYWTPNLTSAISCWLMN